MARKTPMEKIAVLQKSLAEAKAKARRIDSQAKIVIGGLFLKEMRINYKLRTFFFDALEKSKQRPQDMMALMDVLEELRKLPHPEQSASHPTPTNHFVNREGQV